MMITVDSILPKHEEDLTSFQYLKLKIESPGGILEQTLPEPFWRSRVVQAQLALN